MHMHHQPPLFVDRHDSFSPCYLTTTLDHWSLRDNLSTQRSQLSQSSTVCQGCAKPHYSRTRGPIPNTLPHAALSCVGLDLLWMMASEEAKRVFKYSNMSVYTQAANQAAHREDGTSYNQCMWMAQHWCTLCNITQYHCGCADA
jgi:hypothetical protein